MFNWFTKRTTEAIESRMAELESEELRVIERTIAASKAEMMLDLEKAALKVKQGLDKDLQELALGGAKQKGEYEHDYHSAMEEKKVELAKLQAHIEHLRGVRDDFRKESILELKGKDEVIATKKAEITRLENIINKLIVAIEKVGTPVEVTNNNTNQQ